MRRDTVLGTFAVAAILCVACSVLVSSAAVGLRPFQAANKERDRKKNILEAAQLIDAKNPTGIDQKFESVEVRIVDLATGDYVDSSVVDPATYDQVMASKDPQQNVAIAAKRDIAGIKQREKYSFVYLVKDGEKVDQIVLPINGKGLWSTLYGFIAIDSDLTTVRGLTFYSHGETPGLGGEVDNPSWKKQWAGKELLDAEGNLTIEVVKGTVDAASPQAVHQVDGLSGATITSRGVTNLLRYWLGADGFGPYLAKQRARTEADDGKN